MIMDDAALDQDALLDGRFAGLGRHDETIAQVLPFLAVGTVLALLLARPLNAMAMGDDTARALGAHLNRTRALVDARRHRCCAGPRPPPAGRSSSSG